MLLRLQQAAVPGRLLPLTGELAAGQLLHVAGPNGAGKSTLLSVIAGLQPRLRHGAAGRTVAE